MFLGRYYHSLETKGRLAIPAPFRRRLGPHPVLTRGLDGCLYLLSRLTWQKLVTELHPSPLAATETRTLTRLLAHDATEVNFDSQGRALVSRELRQFAQLTKAVVIAGSIDWVEIWDQSRYRKHLNNATQEVDQLADRLVRLTHNPD